MELPRPSRSDMHLSVEEEAKVEEETRDYFDGVAPKRHSKPLRSEYSTQYVDSFPTENAIDGGSNPELIEFQRLEKDDHEKVVNDGRSEATEDFVETEYYKDLNCVDKQHHTTGTGFIKVDEADGHGFSLEQDSALEAHHASSRGNPATNDWVPSAPDMDTHISDKPKRSEN